MQNVMKLFNVLRIVRLLSVNEGDISILILPLRFSDLYCALELDTSDSFPAFLMFFLHAFFNQLNENTVSIVELDYSPAIIELFCNKIINN